MSPVYSSIPFLVLPLLLDILQRLDIFLMSVGKKLSDGKGIGDIGRHAKARIETIQYTILLHAFFI